MSTYCQCDNNAVAGAMTVTLYNKIHLLNRAKNLENKTDYFLLFIYINLGCLPLIAILMVLSCKKVIFLYVDIY